MSEGRTWTLIGPDRRPYESEVPGTLGGHRRTKIYGRLDCPGAARAIARGGYVKNRVFFLDEETAIAAGYRPGACCMPEEYRKWKGNPASGRPEPAPLSVSGVAVVVPMMMTAVVMAVAVVMVVPVAAVTR
jgi:hypothetical protein